MHIVAFIRAGVDALGKFNAYAGPTPIRGQRSEKRKHSPTRVLKNLTCRGGAAVVLPCDQVGGKDESSATAPKPCVLVQIHIIPFDAIRNHSFVAGNTAYPELSPRMDNNNNKNRASRTVAIDEQKTAKTGRRAPLLSKVKIPPPPERKAWKEALLLQTGGLGRSWRGCCPPFRRRSSSAGLSAERHRPCGRARKLK